MPRVGRSGARRLPFDPLAGRPADAVSGLIRPPDETPSPTNGASGSDQRWLKEQNATPRTGQRPTEPRTAGQNGVQQASAPAVSGEEDVQSMLRWGWGRKKPSSTPECVDHRPLSEDGAPAGDEWAFLRTQPDHDADEMSAVHCLEDAPFAELASPPAAAPAPAAEPVAEPEDRTWPPPRLAVRGWSPRKRRPAPAYLETSGAPTVPATLPLPLEIEYLGELWDHLVEAKTLLGRTDEDRGLFPELDFSEDDAISRIHARIFSLRGCWAIQDLNSTNGTLWNGQSLDPEFPVHLHPGDELELGESVRIRVLTAPHPDSGLGEAGDADGGTALSDEDRSIRALLEEAGGPAFAAPTFFESAHAEPHLRPEVLDLLDVALDRMESAGWLTSDTHPQTRR